MAAQAIGPTVPALEAGASRVISCPRLPRRRTRQPAYHGVSSNNATATVSVAADRSGLTVEGVAQGTATIEVTARDSDGNTVNDTFAVSVVPAPEPEPEEDEKEEEASDGAPTVVSPLPDLSLEGLEWREFTWPSVQDPHGDDLTYTAASSDYGVARGWWNDSR